METGLGAWKNGEPAKDFAGRSEGIQFSDPDWAAGYRLLDYDIQSMESAGRTMARGAALLSLQDHAGKRIEKEVVYDLRVADGDVVIGRDPFN